MAFLDAARGAALSMKQMTGTSMSQIGNKMSANADVQKALRGASDDLDMSSGLVNPYNHEESKYDMMEDIRDRHTGTWRKIIDRSILQHLTAGLTQLTPYGGFSDALKTLGGMKSEVAAQLVKLGQLKSAGWKLTRLTEMWAMICKQYSVSAESSVRFEAPTIVNAAMVHATEAHLHLTTADLKMVAVKDEIHRVADAFGLDAQYLTALLSATAKIHAQGNIELFSGASLDISATTEVNIKSGVDIKMSSPLLTIVDTAGATITIAEGIINLNPLVAGTPDTAAIVAPVVTVTADSWPHATVMKSQYEGANPHGTNII